MIKKQKQKKSRNMTLFYLKIIAPSLRLVGILLKTFAKI